MKKKIGTALVCAAGLGWAHAQAPAPVAAAATTSVQLYGIVDTGVERLSHVGAGSGGVTRMPSLSGGQLPSRWGLRGVEDLGDGLKGIFTLESGFGVDTGQALQGGRLFGRQAFVGLTGNWGTLSLGRHWSMIFFSMLDADVIGPAVFGLAAFDSYIPSARMDNSVSYRGSFAGLSLGATYSFGRDGLQPANCAGETGGSACRAWSALVKYDSAGWGVALAHDKLNGGAAGNFLGQPAGTLPNVNNTEARTVVNGYVKVAGAKVGAGWVRRRMQAQPVELATDVYFAGLSVPFTSFFSVDAQLLSLHDERPDANARMLVVRGNYALSRRTSVYAMVGHVSNKRAAAYSVSGSEVASAAPVAGQGQSGLMLGIRHSF